MRKFLRVYGFLSAQLLGVLGVTICSLWFGAWYDGGKAIYLDLNKTDVNDTIGHLQTATFWEVTVSNIGSVKTPIPYMVFSLFLSLVGGAGGVRNQLKLNSYDKLESDHRFEKNEHGLTRKNYFEAIDYIILSIFVSTDADFDENCRISIYRHTSDGQLKRTYRHASKTMYDQGGRLKIPDNEGVVGAAWLNEGVAHISLNSNFGTVAYQKQLAKEMAEHGAEPPSVTTNMPTLDYFAMAIRNSSRAKMAVVVLESTIAKRWSRDKLVTKITQENSEIAKYIIHKGKLDEVLNPDGDSDHG